MSKELLVVKNRIIESPVLKNILGSDLEKYATNIVAEIARTAGDDKKDLSKCSPDSIVGAIKKACDLKLTVDGRQHCHLVKYGTEAQLQIGYRGFIYAIKRAYPDANIDVQLVYAEDEFKLVKEGDITTYSLERKNPFAAKDKIIGGFCYISYSVGSRLVSFCETLSIEEINKIKGCAKQDFIWKAWFEEKAKVAIIKRACKIHFSGINKNLAELTEYDNQEFDLTKEPVVTLEESDLITTEQAFEIEKLAKEAGVEISKINQVYGIDAIIQLPLSKYAKVVKKLGLNKEAKPNA